MKKFTLANIKKTGKWVLPAGIVALGLVSIAVSQPSAGKKAAVVGADSAASSAQAPESPAPTATPNISVNGQTIPTDTQGSTEVDIPGGKAHVEVSGDHTTVTTHDNESSGSTSNSQSGNVSVNIDSQSSGGTSWGSTRVFGFNTSSGNSGTSLHSTSIFSADNGHVSVSNSQ